MSNKWFHFINDDGKDIEINKEYILAVEAADDVENPLSTIATIRMINGSEYVLYLNYYEYEELLS